MTFNLLKTEFITTITFSLSLAHVNLHLSEEISLRSCWNFINSLWLSLRAKDFSMCLLLLLCCTYSFTALSNWKHQKLSGAENLSMSSGKCAALAPYYSLQEMQHFQARHLKFSIISSVQTYLPELKTNSTILGTGAHSFNSPSGSNPFKTNSDAVKPNFWYSSASRENQEQLALKILSRKWQWWLTQSAPLVTFN